MIYLGYDDDEKRAIIADYQREHTITATVVIFWHPLPIVGTDQVPYAETIMYRTFYRLLQEITPSTLVVVNECLRTQNRYDLTLNCIRNFLNLTRHALVFQYLPIIDTREDIMILFDLATQSRWKREHFDAALISEQTTVALRERQVTWEAVPVTTSEATRAKYRQERERLFDQPPEDPHVIPRNLYLLGGPDKKRHITQQTGSLFGDPAARYVARNKRLALENVTTFNQVDEGVYEIVELPHRFIDFTDFLYRSRQTHCRLLTADLNVDAWYRERYQQWSERLHETYASLRRKD